METRTCRCCHRAADAHIRCARRLATDLRFRIRRDGHAVRRRHICHVKELDNAAFDRHALRLDRAHVRDIGRCRACCIDERGRACREVVFRIELV